MVRADYEQFPTFWDDPHLRKWNLWGYVDESHVTQSVRLALDADIDGADSFIIAAADTVMKRPSRELMAEVFPGVPVADSVDGTDTLLDIRKARNVLGYSPEFSWRQILPVRHPSPSTWRVSQSLRNAPRGSRRSSSARKSPSRSYSGADLAASARNSLPQCGRASNGASARSTSTSALPDRVWLGCPR